MNVKFFLPLSAVVAVCGLMAGAIFLQGSGDVGRFLPHGYCFTWNPRLLWANVISDAAIGIAYTAIPLILVRIKSRRNDIPFDWLFLLFALFIISCGATHWIEVWTVWNPDYWLSANVKIVTAIASVATAIALIAISSRIINIPTTAELRAAKEQLDAVMRESSERERQLRAELEVLTRHRNTALATADGAKNLADSERARADRAKSELDAALRKTAAELRHALANEVEPRQPADKMVSQIAYLIEELEDFSALDQVPPLCPVDVSNVLMQVREYAQQLAISKSVKIIITDNSDGQWVLADARLLVKALRHLVANAIDASEPESNVLLTAYLRERQMVISVRDWGKGLPEISVWKLTRPFAAPANPSKYQPGLGLGLSLVQRWVQTIGGSLEIRGREVGRGVMCLVLLDVAEQAVASGDAFG